MLQHAAVAELDYHDLEGVVFVDVVASHDVLAIAKHHQLRLGFAEAAADLAHFLVGLELDCSQIEHFDSYHAFGLVVHALVDLSECAASDLAVYDVFIDSCVGD